MKRLFLFFLLIGYWSVVRASDTVFIKEAQVPILIELWGTERSVYESVG